jgi:hypothetical protein
MNLLHSIDRMTLRRSSEKEAGSSSAAVILLKVVKAEPRVDSSGRFLEVPTEDGSWSCCRRSFDLARFRWAEPVSPPVAIAGETSETIEIGLDWVATTLLSARSEETVVVAEIVAERRSDLLSMAVSALELGETAACPWTVRSEKVAALGTPILAPVLPSREPSLERWNVFWSPQKNARFAAAESLESAEYWWDWFVSDWSRHSMTGALLLGEVRMSSRVEG